MTTNKRQFPSRQSNFTQKVGLQLLSGTPSYPSLALSIFDSLLELILGSYIRKESCGVVVSAFIFALLHCSTELLWHSPPYPIQEDCYFKPTKNKAIVSMNSTKSFFPTMARFHSRSSQLHRVKWTCSWPSTSIYKVDMENIPVHQQKPAKQQFSHSFRLLNYLSIIKVKAFLISLTNHVYQS